MAFECADFGSAVGIVAGVFFGDSAKDELTAERTSAMQGRCETFKYREDMSDELFLVPLVKCTGYLPVLTLVAEYGSAEHKPRLPTSTPQCARRSGPCSSFPCYRHGCTTETHAAIPSENIPALSGPAHRPFVPLQH